MENGDVIGEMVERERRRECVRRLKLGFVFFCCEVCWRRECEGRLKLEIFSLVVSWGLDWTCRLAGCLGM